MNDSGNKQWRIQHTSQGGTHIALGTRRATDGMPPTQSPLRAHHQLVCWPKPLPLPTHNPYVLLTKPMQLQHAKTAHSASAAAVLDYCDRGPRAEVSQATRGGRIADHRCSPAHLLLAQDDPSPEASGTAARSSGGCHSTRTVNTPSAGQLTANEWRGH